MHVVGTESHRKLGVGRTAQELALVAVGDAIDAQIDEIAPHRRVVGPEHVGGIGKRHRVGVHRTTPAAELEAAAGARPARPVGLDSVALVVEHLDQQHEAPITEFVAGGIPDLVVLAA